MTLYDLSCPYAEARKSSMTWLNSGDFFLYLNFHLLQSVPAGALLASSTTCMSLILKSVLLDQERFRLARYDL